MSQAEAEVEPRPELPVAAELPVTELDAADDEATADLPDAWRLLRLRKLLKGIETAIVGVAVLSIFAVVLAQSLFRYFLNKPLRWSSEVSQLGLMWMTFMGSALVMAKNAHVTIRIFGRVLGPGGRKLLAITGQLAVVGACVVFVRMGYDTTRSWMSRRMPITGWPAGLGLVASLSGFALMGLHAALNILIILRHGYDDREAKEYR